MTSPLLPFYVLAGVLGLTIGSFLNVVIYRLPREESLLFPSSHCHACNSPVKLRHNVPVLSWILLRGKCAACKMRISVRHPLIEAGTALLFVAITVRFGISVELPAFLYLAAVAVTLAMIDFDAGRLPDSIVLPSYVVGALLLMPAGAVDGTWWSAYRGVIGMAALWTFYFALTIAYPTGMALGEVKVAGLLGLYLGYTGWSTVLIGAFGGFLLGGVGGAAFASGGRNHIPWSSRQPTTRFGPYMFAAALIALFVAGPMTTWYGSLLGTA